MLAMTPAWGLEPSAAHLLLSTALLLCCILCMGCLILVIVAIRLVILFRVASLLNLHQEPKADSASSAGAVDSRKIIKSLTDPLHKLIQAAHNHFTPQPSSKPTSPPTTPTSASPSSYKMTDPLQDVTAVVTPVANQDIVFHIAPESSESERRQISFWTSKSADEKRGKQYGTENLKISENPIYVNRKLTNLAAVAYKNPHTNKDEVRVYYVDENSLHLREARRTDDEDWVGGHVFNQQNYEISPTSGLTANVVTIRTKISGGDCDHPAEYKTEYQLKIYFQRNNDFLNVAYNVLNESNENWSLRYGVNK